MDDPFSDERLRFFLRHRDEIREWAAIEREVVAATRNVLAGVQVLLADRLAALDDDVTTTRADNASFERILARRPDWPDRIGVALEWELQVDPFGARLPVEGVIFLEASDRLDGLRADFVRRLQSEPSLVRDGFKVPASRWWPAMRRTPRSRDWWQDPAAWSSSIADSLTDVWARTAPHLDGALQHRRI